MSTKMKAQNESISLEKKHQSKFARKVSKLKESKQPTNETEGKEKKPINKIERGIIYVGHIPHGFYENEMRAFFTQFGDVVNVRVNRSKRTGNSKGFGFIEFADPDVAKVAATSMNNYLMFQRRLICNYVPIEKQFSNIFTGEDWRGNKHPKIKERKENIALKNTDWTDAAHIKHSMKMMKRLRHRMNLLKEMGIEHTFEPVDIPEEVTKREQQREMEIQNRINKRQNKQDKTESEKVESDISDEESLMEDESDSDEECGKFVRLMKPTATLKTIKKKKAAVKPKKINADKMKLAAKSVLADFDNKTKAITKKAKTMKKR